MADNAFGPLLASNVQGFVVVVDHATLRAITANV